MICVVRDPQEQEWKSRSGSAEGKYKKVVNRKHTKQKSRSEGREHKSFKDDCQKAIWNSFQDCSGRL